MREWRRIRAWASGVGVGQGDGNADGTPDKDQANVASLPNSVDGKYMTLVAPSGLQLARALGPEPIPGPE